MSEKLSSYPVTPEADAQPKAFDTAAIGTLPEEHTHTTPEQETAPERLSDEERQRQRVEYAFHTAEFHLNHEFMIGDEKYIVDSIWYTGDEEKNAYITTDIIIKNVKTGVVSEKLTPDTVNEIVDAAKKAQTGEVSENQTVPDRLAPSPEIAQEFAQQAQLQESSQNLTSGSSFEPAQFQAFLQEHPELAALEVLPKQNETSTEEHAHFIPAPPTIDAITNQGELTEDMITQKGIDAIVAFNELANQSDEFELLRDEFMADLEAYLLALEPGQQAEYDLAS